MTHRRGLRSFVFSSRLYVVMFAVLGSLFTPLVAAAQEEENITISPAQQRYQVDAGKEHSGEMKVINNGKTAYDFIVYARPYSVQGETYEPDFQSTPKNADIYGWVRFEKTDYHLEPDEEVIVKYSINIPADATPGGHYGVIFAETQPSEAAQANSVIRKKRVGSIIYATVNGSYETKGEALDSEIPFWQVEPPLRVSMRAKNTGNTDFSDKTVMTVKDVFGNVKFRIEKELLVLPKTTRKIDMEWKNANWFGLYNVETSQEILGKTTTSSGYILMMPRYLPIILLVIIVIGGVYVFIRRKKH